MKTLQRYIGRDVLFATLLIFGALLALFAFFDLIHELGDVGRGDYTISRALLFVTLNLPSRLYELFPVAALIGTLFAVSQLVANSEYTVMRASGMRRRLRRGGDRFTDLSHETDQAAAGRIFADQVDVLVDLKGQAGGARVGIAARRPAPVQVNWLGFPGTMGADWFDYIIADRHVIPDARRHDYAEQVVRLPCCYQSNDRRRPRPAADARARVAHGLPDDAVVLCCFNQAYKITPGVFAAWMSVLRSVPRSVLWLLHDNARATENLRAHASSHGCVLGEK